ncbi:MAG: Secreted repeat of unknown function [Methanosaeta sp. PtaB.Bin039]|nr:MAG: Secreted repeat of unknown function [Methanosaeta sp. PtaB.Bin039]OPY45737.1 MAG: Secreted repeat of unknown function [Methanosaeta sp. PtaU1.Bin028]HOT06578.1 hypothetical protein [Methanotrichaceae archaeon]HQF16540.1 hypothetical protein [Methanotrichaceae archaeon]HQI91089.1 hypothetical protein [Methanotrichaceae archaeon]
MSKTIKLGLAILAVWFLAASALAQDNYTINVSYNKFFGPYLVNQSGFTLYYFTDDAGKAGSECYGDCAQSWPPFYAENIRVPDSLRGVDFTTQKRTDGRSQTAFRGWPLYLYVGDRASGDYFGRDLDQKWYPVDPTNQRVNI